MESSNNEENVPRPPKVLKNRLFLHALRQATTGDQPKNSYRNFLDSQEANCKNAVISGNEKEELNTKDKPHFRRLQSYPASDVKSHKYPDKSYNSYQTDSSRSNIGWYTNDKDFDTKLQNHDHLHFKEHRNYFPEHKTQLRNRNESSYRYREKLRRSYSGEEEQNVSSNQKGEIYDSCDQEYRTKSKNDHLKQHRERLSISGNGNRTGYRTDLNNYKGNKSCVKEEFSDLNDHVTEKHANYDIKSGTEYAEKYHDQEIIKVSKKTDLDDYEIENIGSFCEFSKINHHRKVSEVNGDYVISFQNNEQSTASVTAFSKSFNLELPGGSKENLKNESTVTDQNVKTQNIFLPVEDNFIPPPVQPSPDDAVLCLNNGNFDIANESLSTNESEVDYSSLPEPDAEHLEAVTQYITGIVQEKSVNNDLARKVTAKLNGIFSYHLEGNVIGLYGSYYTDLAITTSDINFVMTSDTTVKKSFMREVHKVLSSELKKYNVHPFEEGTSISQTKIIFSEPDFGICCQLVYLRRPQIKVFDMGEFLKRVCSYDSRVKTLIVAVKIWAETCLINEFEEGKLHPVGFALLMVHFLQQYETPVLPIFSHQDDKTRSSPPHCNASVGELWVAFLRYYTLKFDWKHDVVIVNSKECVSKKSKGWETYWIAIEDPFSKKNIADSVVNSDIADYIKGCFKASYGYFLSPPENSIADSAYEDSLSNENICGKWQFSFQLCTVDNSDVFCDACDELDDICEDCKKKIYVPPMPALPEMSDSFLKVIREALYSVSDRYMLTDNEVNERKMFVDKLQKDVQKSYPEAKLKLFGSSTNGFGFKTSDLDICMTFKEKEKINPTAVLRNLRTLLRRDKNFGYVYVIFRAQIPIIKFHYQPKGWRGDISLNNVLAVHNSELLHKYSIIDERCKILGCALKLLSKKALIAEVTDKALSSYSYLLMVIHFLQQTDPPVLPVLQDPKLREDYQLSEVVEGWNVWFCKDLNYAEKFYRDIYETKNETSVEQLWLDLLDFYCSYENNCFITIRQKEPLLLKENQRSARLFNIQDPFILNKNLGCVVSAKKAQESENIFRRARFLFRSPVKEFHSSVKDAEDYFFSTMSLTGKIQKEAHCNSCGKYGHEDQDCNQSYFLNRRNLFRKFPAKNRHYMQKKQINRKYL